MSAVLADEAPPTSRYPVLATTAELDRLIDETRDAIIANDDIRALRVTDELRALAHRMRGTL